jgi:hypothetical protein
MFDSITERCIDCDGHFTHSDWCPNGTPSSLSLEARIDLQRFLNEVTA